MPEGACATLCTSNISPRCAPLSGPKSTCLCMSWVRPIASNSRQKNTVFEKGPLITNHHHPLWLVMGHTKGIFACHSPSSNFGKDQTFRRRPAGQKGELERGSPHFKPRPTYNLPVVWPIISSQPLPVMAKKTERARWNRWRPGGPFLASPKKTSRGASTSYASRGGEEKHRPADVRGSPRLRRRGV